MKLKKKRKRKLTSLFLPLLFVLFNVSTLSLSAQKILTEKITLQIDHQPVENVFKQISDQCGVKFFYGETVIYNEQTVTLNVKNTPLKTVLEEITRQTFLQFSREGNTISVSTQKRLTKTNPIGFNNTKTISGTIVDQTGLPIIGANVVVKGTTLGTITGLDGEFTLEVPAKSSLSISYIGYVSKEIVVGTNTVYSIVLAEDSKALDEVVVTALGIKREEKALGYSVQKIGGEELSVVKGTDVASSLTGKIAGLSINNSAEISEKPELKLRGENPLIVIDGIAYGNMTLSDVSADDIESIDVLKGATASALYGVRGRAGAIMITTRKSGKSGTLSVNVSNNTMFSAGYLTMPEAQASYSTGNYGKLEYNSGYVWGDYMDGHDVNQYNPETMQVEKMPLLSKGKNNISNFFRPSMVTNTNVNISQAGELGGFRVSATQVHHEGQYPNTQLDKYILTGGGNITYNKFRLDANFSYKKEMAPNMPKVNYGGGNILYNMLIWGGTEYDIRDFKNYWKVKDQKQNWPFEAWYDNPYYIMNERINKQNKDLFNASVTLNYDIKENLSVMFRSGYDNYGNTEENRQSVGDSGQKRGYYKYAQYLGSSFNNDVIFKGEFKWNDFGLDFISGLSSYWYKTTDFYANTRGGLSVPGFYSLNASVERPDVSKAIQEKALYSAYGKAGISWKNGVYVDITGRNDWSSTLPSSSRSYFYPSVSASFLPASFYNPIEGILDFWKIRASWTVAKKDMDVYDINSVYTVNTDVWDGQSTATYPTKLRDPHIKPETEISYEIGTDFRFFNNRLGFDLTYFNRLRYDRLIESDISIASGSEKIITNTQEELMQKGMEFTLRGKPIVSKEFEWESSFNGAFWHWYYHKLDPVYSSKDPRIGKGERYDKFFMTDWERDHNGKIVHQAGLPVKNKYETVMGYSDPKFIWGFTNRFVYKNIELNISIDGRVGGLMYSWTEQAMWHSGAHPDSDNQWRHDEVVEGKQNFIGSGVKVVEGSASYDPYGNVIEDTRKFSPNDIPVSYQSYTMVYNENPWDHEAYQNIKDATFIKLREVALNYTLPSDITHRILMKNVRVGIIGQNLLMWTKEFNYSDPDRGKENLNSPTARYIGFNINLTL
ncbi:MAG: SusC/RagA family TonB-linked outer membrane protein [Massilibacteroides sp.]|nr:SusC/RagA family TonB-linked outer membrane protein [Massilibacteroides sp.]MDD3063117.1 SusC/RagA family TonB-linked outer membrane protein [Massilibacteroides sp.]MDD4115952.1 SusC/RagA family TonB-linked outer membrane protein [Massilibacteroides sp.]MDD4661569.1 SusC/RagA family TonB-linked outer membrane protein [Massilibacteroides sp.]